jgi:hypothetical protein
MTGWIARERMGRGVKKVITSVSIPVINRVTNKW